MIVQPPPPPIRRSRRVAEYIAWTLGMVALGFAIQVGRAALHIITGGSQ